MAAVAGVADFTGKGITLTGSIGDKTMTASVTISGTTITSPAQTITLNVGAATKVALIHPAAGAANRIAFTTQPDIEIQDSAGNKVSSGSYTIHVAVGAGAVVDGQNDVGSQSGVVNWSWAVGANQLSLRGAVGNYTITYSSTGLTSATQSISLTHGAATQLVLHTAAAGAQAGIAFSTQPVVYIEDADNNLVNTNGESLLHVAATSSDSNISGTTVVQASGGIAAFNDLKLSDVTGSYHITYSVAAAGIESGYSALTTTQSVSLSAGTAVKLMMTQQPSTGGPTGSAFSTQPKVAVVDAFDNIVLTDTGRTVTASYSGANGGTLSGSPNLTATTSSGIATFSGLKFVGLPGQNYVLHFAVANNGLTATDSNNFTVTYAAASKLVITQQPVGGNATRSALTLQPIVEIRDAYDNLITGGADSTRTVTINIHSDNNAGRGDLSMGTLSVAAVGGVATFSGVILSDAKINNNYTFDFSATLNGASVTSSASNAIQVVHAAADHITLSTAVAGAKAGLAFTTQPVVQVRDIEENVVTDGAYSNALIEVATSNGSTLSGTASMHAVAGQAAFTGLSLAGTMASYTLSFSSNTLNTVTQQVSLSYGAADHLGITTQPVGGNATGSALATQPVVKIYDAYNNLVANATNSVTASIATGDGQASVSAGATKAAVAGVAAFNGLTLVATPGVDYTLIFSATGLTDATSNAISLTHAPASQIVISTQPLGGNATGNDLTRQPVIRLLDQFGNLVTSDRLEHGDCFD